jgi:hypothetical protein
MPSACPLSGIRPMKRWFLGLLVVIALWVGYNAIAHEEYDASLRPIYWLLEETGLTAAR